MKLLNTMNKCWIFFTFSHNSHPKKTNTVYYQLYVESKQWTKLLKQNKLTDIEDKLMAISGEREVGSGKIYVEDWDTNYYV